MSNKERAGLEEMCPTCHRGDPVCETHLRHSDEEYDMAYDLTGGRFQLFVYPSSPETLECRSRSVAKVPRESDLRTIHRVLQRWLDMQYEKGKAGQ